MPNTTSLSSQLSSTGVKALFVVLVMLFNFAFSLLSSASAYAQTTEETVVSQDETEPVVEEESEPKEEAPEGNTETEESTKSKDEAESEESETVEQPSNTEPQVLSTEEVEVTVVPTVPEVPKLPELEANFGCWTRTGLLEYSFTVNIESDDDYEWEPGTPLNNADPEEYESILPDEFEEDEYTETVEGWDGGDFAWTLGVSVIEVSLENDPCEDNVTIADIIVENIKLEGLEELVGASTEARECRLALKLLASPDAGPFTVFAPRNSAIANLVTTPPGPNAEFNQLAGNPDELCALIGSHIVAGEFQSSDVDETGVTLPAVTNDVDGIFVQLVNGKVYADGALVSEADLFAANGIVHIVDSVLLPQSVGTINPIVTDMTSPELSGSIVSPMIAVDYETEFEFCVVVRVNGTPHIAIVDGHTWTVPEGEVELNPSNPATLFDVIVREGYGNYYDTDDVNGSILYGCEYPEIEYPQIPDFRGANDVEVVTHGARLLGLTMVRGIASLPEQPEEPEEEPEEPGEVLGETTDDVVVVEEEPVVVQPVACGKGVCGNNVAQAYDPNTTDTDGDGVVDAEDPDPNDPNVTGAEDESESDETASENGDEEQNDEEDNTNVLLWFIAGGGVVGIWYLLWQRSGREF